MLIDNLPKFQSELYNILFNSSSEAFLTTISNSGNTSIDSDCKTMLREMANSFGEKFASEAAPEMAKSIMQYIQSAGLNIVMLPQGLATIVSPAGPCSGSLLINDTTANINIM